MLKIVLDTNVYISALLFGGYPRHILRQVIEGKLELYVSDSILDEIADVLSRPKFSYPTVLLHQFLTEIEAISELVAPIRQVNCIKNDPTDNRIIECAIAANASHIVTGDHHLLELKEFETIIIVSPSDFLRL